MPSLLRQFAAACPTLAVFESRPLNFVLGVKRDSLLFCFFVFYPEADVFAVLAFIILDDKSGFFRYAEIADKVYWQGQIENA